eukprot:scaffold126758_cov98-Cyclotella_meneghiniana.AAC.2
MALTDSIKGAVSRLEVLLTAESPVLLDDSAAFNLISRRRENQTEGSPKSLSSRPHAMKQTTEWHVIALAEAVLQHRH